MLTFEETELDGVIVVSPARFQDSRGYFMETYAAHKYDEPLNSVKFVQDNESFSASKHTVRGLHYQSPPFAQAKLVRVLLGKILDVAVDIRKSSPNYGKSVAVELDAAEGRQLFVPAGFLHGFLTLADNTLVAYKVSAPYNKDADGSVHFASAGLDIDWRVDPSAAVLSDKDAAAIEFKDFESPFE